MDLGTEVPLLEVCRRELISNHHLALLNNPTSGCQVLLQNDRNDDLHTMYHLYNHVNCLEPMAAIVERHIKRYGIVA